MSVIVTLPNLPFTCAPTGPAQPRGQGVQRRVPDVRPDRLAAVLGDGHGCCWSEPAEPCVGPAQARGLRDPTMGDEARILIVCTGNICRSPFIERLLQHELDSPGNGFEQGIIVRSAGTGALVGF